MRVERRTHGKCFQQTQEIGTLELTEHQEGAPTKDRRGREGQDFGRCGMISTFLIIT